MAEYWKRIVDEELQLRLEAFGATLIVGPKWCGKTTTGMQKAKSVLRMQDPDMREGYLMTAQTKPSLLLKGDTPRLIDEWQDAPVLWDAVRTAVDERQAEGQFILTGSTSVDNHKILHTGTGRISRLKMYPMSLYESRESNGQISIKDLFDDQPEIDGIMSDLSVEDYARNVSTLAKKTNILRDMSANAESMTLPTMESYLNALEKLFVIEDLDAWCPAIRSATVIRSGKKREFTDPSIAAAAMGMTPQYLEQDLKTFGFIFECLCIRDLKIYSQALGGKISYYHDRYGLEADAVLHLDDGRYALIEFKLGSREIEEGAQHLLELAGLIRKYNEKESRSPLREPDLLMIITGGNMAYTRADGVKIVPIGCLKN